MLLYLVSYVYQLSDTLDATFSKKMPWVMLRYCVRWRSNDPELHCAACPRFQEKSMILLPDVRTW